VFISSTFWFLIILSKSAAIWNVKPSITKGLLGMTRQWAGMRSNPNCRILPGYVNQPGLDDQGQKVPPPTLGTETSYVPRGKEINRDSTTSGERTWTSYLCQVTSSGNLCLRLCGAAGGWEGTQEPSPPCQDPTPSETLSKVVCGLAKA